jgi:hypothetical protein
MRKTIPIPLKKAQEILEVDPTSASGLRWSVNRRRVKAGDEAGCLNKTTGYYRVKINQRPYKAHRVVMAMTLGDQIPDELDIDHINNNRGDNRFENLRLVSSKDNSRKKLHRKGCSSRFKGVCWHKICKKFMAYIRVDGHRKHLGYFDSEVEAAKAYDEAALKYFGESNCVLNCGLT